MIQQSHSWGYTQKNVTQVTPEEPARPCLLQHYSYGFICIHLLCAEFLAESFVLVAWWSFIISDSGYHRRFLSLHIF
jgi:hypothetical protein